MGIFLNLVYIYQGKHGKVPKSTMNCGLGGNVVEYLKDDLIG